MDDGNVADSRLSCCSHDRQQPLPSRHSDVRRARFSWGHDVSRHGDCNVERDDGRSAFAFFASPRRSSSCSGHPSPPSGRPKSPRVVPSSASLFCRVNRWTSASPGRRSRCSRRIDFKPSLLLLFEEHCAMRSVKLILVLILFGAALIIGALMPADANSTAPSPSLGTWVMGLLGVAFLCAGVALLRRGYVEARAARGGGPLTASLKLLLTFSGVVALAVIVFAVSHVSPQAAKHSEQERARCPWPSRTTSSWSKGEIKRRQGNDQPASAPGVPADASR